MTVRAALRRVRSDVRAQGHVAGHRRLALATNPYPLGSMFWTWWAWGWLEGRKS